MNSFIELYYLYCLKEKTDFPDLNVNFIHKCIKTICESDGRGRAIAGKNLVLLSKLEKFYDKEFKFVLKEDKISSSKLNQSLLYLCTQVLTYTTAHTFQKAPQNLAHGFRLN